MKKIKNNSIVVAAGIVVIMILPFALIVLALVALFGYEDKIPKMLFPDKTKGDNK